MLSQKTDCGRTSLAAPAYKLPYFKAGLRVGLKPSPRRAGCQAMCIFLTQFYGFYIDIELVCVEIIVKQILI